MKTKIKLFLVFNLLLAGFANAQTTWWHTSGQLRTGIPSGGFNGASANTGSLLFYNSSNTNTVSFQSGVTTTSYTMTLPTAAAATNGYVLSSTTGGVLSWSSAAQIGAWSILGNSGTSASTNFIGTTDNVDFVVRTNNTEKMRVLSGGNVGIGTTTPVNSLTVSKNIDVDGTIGVMSNGTIQSSVTSNASGFRSSLSTAAASFTLSNLYHYMAAQGTFNSPSTVTNQYGFEAASSLTDATGINAGFRGAIAAGTGRYNCYMTGTALNYFAGDVGIGTTSAAARLHIYTGASSATANGNANDLVIESNETNGLSFLTANNDASSIRFGDNGNSSAGTIAYSHTSDYMNFGTNGGERVRITSAGDVGIGLTNPAYKLDVTGDIHNTGVMAVGMAPSGTYALTINGSGLASGGTWVNSDQQFKTNIDSLQNGLSIIKQLSPKTYFFDTTNVWGFNFDSEKQYGVIAQQLEEVLPSLVKTSTKQADYDTLGNVVHPALTFKAVNYTGLIPILIKGIQELQEKNDSLQTELNKQDSVNTSQQNQMNLIQSQLVTNSTVFQEQLNQLMSTINDCCNRPQESSTNNSQTKSMNTSESGTTQIEVELNNSQIIVLEQNSPNPYAERTSINYYLPDNTGKAEILFYNTQGRLIKSVELINKGKGTLSVFAGDLSSGIYTYTLVVDGKAIETKKMVKQ